MAETAGLDCQKLRGLLLLACMSSVNENYVPRVIDSELDALLDAVGAVVVEGPKACGKTASALQRAGTVVSLDRDENARTLGMVAPQQLLVGAPPVVLDEWQLVPQLWNVVRHECDDRSPAKGQFILTGSSTPDDDVRRHSGAGRFARLQMRPMSLYERGQSNGAVSLEALLRGQPPAGKGEDLDIPTLAELLVIGGWPGLIESSAQAAMRVNQGYIDQIVEVDIPRLTGNKRDPVKMRRLVTALARAVGNYRSESKLATEAGGSDAALDRGTVATYLEVLTRLHILEDLPAWNSHLRSRAALMQQTKRMFVDPSLAVAALGASADGLLADLEFMGFLFENLVVRDLRVLAQPLGGQVSHARTSGGIEVDAIVALRDGSWAAFEVKLGESWVDAGAESLKKFARTVDTERAGEPKALVVIVPSGYAYRREDGVDVVPLSALGV